MSVEESLSLLLFVFHRSRQLRFHPHAHQELGGILNAGLELVERKPAQLEVRFGPEWVGQPVEQVRCGGDRDARHRRTYVRMTSSP